jgi:hypothetical protein
MRPSIGLYGLVLTAACLIVVPSVKAQNQPSAPPSTAAPGAASPSAPGSPSADLPDQKLDAAAAAVKGVSAVRNDYEQKLAQAPDSDKDRIVSEADNAMQKAVTDQGLSVAEYSTILQVAKNDPAVREKLLERLK